MPLIEEDVIPAVALDFMNDDHAEAIEQINQLDTLLVQAQAGDTAARHQISPLLQAIYQHSVEHFSREEAEMVRVNFPPYSCHKGEHERVLSELQTVLNSWQETADITALAHYIQHTLPQWLRAHVETMDTVTAMFIRAQQ